MHWRQYQEMQKVVEVGDRFISYAEVGSGPALVLLHGMPTWGYLFHRLLPALERGRRVLVPDLPGFGFSDRSDRFDRSLSSQAERLSAWMQAVGVERASIVGHDIGGGVALRLAVQHPERVDRLGLIDTVSYDSWPAELLHAFGAPSTVNRLSSRAATALLAKALREELIAPDEELIAGLLAPYATEVGKMSLVRDAAALDANETMELVPLLPSLQSPALIVWGENDRLQPAHFARRLAWDLPVSRLAVLPEAGHFCLIDKPAAVAAQLQAFLDLPRALLTHALP